MASGKWRQSARIGAMLLGIGGLLHVPAQVLVTTDASQIAGFLSGTTIQRFDAFAGFPITDYSRQTVPQASQFTKGPAQIPYFNSGGATPGNPAANPGTPIGIFSPQLAGPLVFGTDTAFTDGNSIGFMEIIFPEAVSKVGFHVTHGSLSLFLRDIDGNNLAGNFSATASAGQFVGIARGAADISIAALVPSGALTIDDLAYGGMSGGGGGASPVPEAASCVTMLLAAACIALLSRKLNGI